MAVHIVDRGRSPRTCVGPANSDFTAEPLRPPDGIFAAYKPTGWSSFNVVHAVRAGLEKTFPLPRIPGRKKRRRIKVGHGGTLDPLASGLGRDLVPGRLTELGGDEILDRPVDQSVHRGVIS